MTDERVPDIKSTQFRLTDYALIAMMILPILACIVLKVLFTPASEGVHIAGAMVYAEFEAPLMNAYISESQVNSWAVMISIFGLCLYLTHGLTAKAVCKRQLAAEWIVEKCEKLVRDNMGGFFAEWGPFIAAIMGLSAFSSLICLVGLFSPTGDVNVTFGWAILVFILIMHYKFRGVQIRHEIIAVELLGTLGPVLDRAEVGAQRQIPGRLDAREHDFFLFRRNCIHNATSFIHARVFLQNGIVAKYFRLDKRGFVK